MSAKGSCYWIAIPGHMYRRDCDKHTGYLYKTMTRPETEGLEPYIGQPCPACGKIVVVDEHSYELVESK